MDADAFAYYNFGLEGGRLKPTSLELVRTHDILQRHLPPPPATVLDVGGGSGVYACWLASLGYTVHLVDAVPLHVEQAMIAIEGGIWHPGDVIGEWEKDPVYRARQLGLIRLMEEEPSLIGFSAHFIAVAEKPG